MFVCTDNKLCEMWPGKGMIEFHDVSLRYSLQLPRVLKNISLVIKPKEKVNNIDKTKTLMFIFSIDQSSCIFFSTFFKTRLYSRIVFFSLLQTRLRGYSIIS